LKNCRARKARSIGGILAGNTKNRDGTKAGTPKVDQEGMHKQRNTELRDDCKGVKTAQRSITSKNPSVATARPRQSHYGKLIFTTPDVKKRSSQRNTQVGSKKDVRPNWVWGIVARKIGTGSGNRVRFVFLKSDIRGSGGNVVENKVKKTPTQRDAIQVV